MEDQEFDICTPYQAFYIQSMLFNTTSAFQSCSIAEKIIKRISDGEMDSQELKDVLLDCLQNVVNQSGGRCCINHPEADLPQTSDGFTQQRPSGVCPER